MTLLADIKTALRITSEDFDSEVQMLIDSALYDMERAGVNPALLALDEFGDVPNPLVKKAVAVLAKADFGYDVQSEAYRFEASYDRILNALLNSSENIAAMEQDAMENAFYGMEPAEVWRSLSYRPTKDEYQQACDWLGVEYSEEATNAELRALLAAACGVEEG